MGTHGPEGTPGNFAWMDGVEAGIAGRITPADVDTKITDERGTERAHQSDTYGTLAQVAAKVTTTDRPVSLRGQAGISFDGTTNSAATVQAIIDSAGIGGQINLGKGGQFVIDGPITTPASSTLVGVTKYIGSGTSPQSTEISFPTLTGTQVGITLGALASMRDLQIRGPGYAATTVKGASGASITAERVQFLSCGQGLYLNNAYYAKLIDCEWRFNAVGLYVQSATNLLLETPRFSCGSEDASLHGIGIDAHTNGVLPLTVVGGAFEDYGTAGGITVGPSSTLSLLGTYFEAATAGSTGSVGIIGTNNSSLILLGCQVNLQEANRWVSMNSPTNSRIFARGNSFYCTTGSSTTPICYVVGTGVATDVDDNIVGLAKGTYGPTVYLGHNFSAGNLRNIGHSLALPATETIRPGRAATASRPSAVTVGSGAIFFDTTLVKPIFSDGTVWRDAAGTAV